MRGLFNVNKPLGMTSHAVVAAVRRIAQTRRVGHAGTLDPRATGVLLLLIGPATRLSQYVMGTDKTYRAVVRLGETTTTYDTEGEVLARQSIPTCLGKAGLPDVESTLSQFRGTISQVPPMYSALKVKGKKLYQLARQGKEIERKPRSVTIYRLDVLAWQPPDLTLEVVCSAGTYIRSLAHDLGQALGCGAHLRALTRTRTGAFHLEESYRVEELRALAAEDRLEEALLPPKAALYMMPFVHLPPAQVQAVRHGQSIVLPPVFREAEAAEGRDEAATSASQVQARDEDDRLVAILVPTVSEAPPNGGKWRPKLVLPPPERSS